MALPPWWLCLAEGLAAGEVAPAEDFLRELPAGCALVASAVLTADQRAAIGRRLGTPLARLSNSALAVQGARVQVNVLTAESLPGAEELHATLLAVHDGVPAHVLRRGRRVIEFCRGTTATATKAAWELGLRPKPQRVRYRVTARLAPVAEADYMAINPLYNALLQASGEADADDALERRIAESLRRIRFGDALALRAPTRGPAGATYAFAPEAIDRAEPADGRLVYRFGELPRVHGVPRVVLTAEVDCRSGQPLPEVREDRGALLAATDRWPVEDPEVHRLATRITRGRRGPEAKVQALLAWLAPGVNVESGGPTGSRWGVRDVLARRRGHCWDFADLFVTLARAADVPARQVGGWLYGTGGHVWAEVLVDDAGWRQVDPTGGGDLACGIYHIPYFTTEDGEMPILYTARPLIEIIRSD